MQRVNTPIMQMNLSHASNTEERFCQNLLEILKSALQIQSHRYVTRRVNVNLSIKHSVVYQDFLTFLEDNKHWSFVVRKDLINIQIPDPKIFLLHIPRNES